MEEAKLERSDVNGLFKVEFQTFARRIRKILLAAFGLVMVGVSIWVLAEIISDDRRDVIKAIRDGRISGIWLREVSKRGNEKMDDTFVQLLLTAGMTFAGSVVFFTGLASALKGRGLHFTGVRIANGGIQAGELSAPGKGMLSLRRGRSALVHPEHWAQQKSFREGLLTMTIIARQRKESGKKNYFFIERIVFQDEKQPSYEILNALSYDNPITSREGDLCVIIGGLAVRLLDKTAREGRYNAALLSQLEIIGCLFAATNTQVNCHLRFDIDPAFAAKWDFLVGPVGKLAATTVNMAKKKMHSILLSNKDAWSTRTFPENYLILSINTIGPWITGPLRYVGFYAFFLGVCHLTFGSS